MQSFRRYIDAQLEKNKGRNLFRADSRDSMQFIDSTLAAIQDLGDLHAGERELLIDYTTDRVLYEFCRVHQYLASQHEARENLRRVYRELCDELQSQTLHVEEISTRHYNRLQDWLEHWNPGLKRVYERQPVELEPVPNSEYSAELQLQVLGIEPSRLMQPVLDVGCGEGAAMLRHLRTLGIEANGIDRFACMQDHMETVDWLQYEFGERRWGSIISHLAFSNHFRHHHLHESGNFVSYARVYMAMLNGLRCGGSLYYAPGLPFIEQYLDRTAYHVDSRPVSDTGWEAVVIHRLC